MGHESSADLSLHEENRNLSRTERGASHSEVRRSWAAGQQTPTEPLFNIMAAFNICAATLLSFLWRSVDVRSALPIQRGAWTYPFKALILPTWENAGVSWMVPCLWSSIIGQGDPARHCLFTKSAVSEKGILLMIFTCLMENVVFSFFLYTFSFDFYHSTSALGQLWVLSAFSFTVPPKGSCSSVLSGVNMEHREAK